MNLLAHIDRLDRQRADHYCPCCKDWLDADDMDLDRRWQHSDAMRARYGAVCCSACTDDHILTVDGVLMPFDATVQGYEGRYSSADALDEARYEARQDAAHEAMCRGWL